MIIMIELLNYIKSEEYRNWLIENEKLLNQWDYLQIINAAQIDIREKIEINPKDPKFLKVVWGVGYKVEDENI